MTPPAFPPPPPNWPGAPPPRKFNLLLLLLGGGAVVFVGLVGLVVLFAIFAPRGSSESSGSVTVTTPAGSPAANGAGGTADGSAGVNPSAPETAAVDVSATTAPEIGGNPLLGSWTLGAGSDPVCADSVEFTPEQYTTVSNGTRQSVATAYSSRGNVMTVATRNIYGFDQFTMNSPASITRNFCSSMSCIACPYTKD